MALIVQSISYDFLFEKRCPRRLSFIGLVMVQRGVKTPKADMI